MKKYIKIEVHKKFFLALPMKYNVGVAWLLLRNKRKLVGAKDAVCLLTSFCAFLQVNVNVYPSALLLTRTRYAALDHATSFCHISPCARRKVMRLGEH